MKKIISTAILILGLLLSPLTSFAYLGESVSSFDTAAAGIGQPEGMAFDGTYLWIVDSTDDEVYKFDTSGTYQSISFDTNASGNDNPIGIVFDGTYFWITDDTDDEVYKYDASGTYQSVSWDTAAWCY